MLLVAVIRPLAVWLSTAFSAYTARERFLLGWAGLRGAAAIVLATLALSAGLKKAEAIFDVVFFVVVISTLLQGTSLERLARRLRLVELRPATTRPPLEVDALGPLELAEFDVTAAHAIAGATVSELGLPQHTLIAVITRGATRGADTIPARGSHPDTTRPPAVHPQPAQPTPGSARYVQPLATARLRRPLTASPAPRRNSWSGS